MAKTIVQLSVPFIFSDEGDYEVTLEKKTALIKVKHVPNRMGLRSYFGVEGPSEGKVEVIPDTHGIANTSGVTIEFPYYIEGVTIPKELLARNITEPILDDISPVVRHCVRYLNRLITVVKCRTHKFWFKTVSGWEDITIRSLAKIDDNGEGIRIMGVGPNGAGIFFPIQIVEQNVVNQNILQTLKSGQNPSVYEVLYIEAVDHFVTARFNDAVILMNVALESLIAEHLIEKLKQKGTSDSDARTKVGDIFDGKKLKTVLNNYFKKIDGRALNDYPDLVKKLDEARLIRKQAVHPFVDALSEEKARKAMYNIMEVANWIGQRSK